MRYWPILQMAMCGTVERGSLYGGPYNAKNSTFVQSYAEGDQEGLSQLINSLTLGEDWGVGANQEIENFILNNGYASPLQIHEAKFLGGYGHSIFQQAALWRRQHSRDPSYEGFWNVQETDELGSVIATLSFRRSNVTGFLASGWNCFSQNPHADGAARLPAHLFARCADQSGGQRKLLPTESQCCRQVGFGKRRGLEDAIKSTAGLRQIRYDATEAPKSCNAETFFMI